MSANFDWQTEEDARRPQHIWDEPNDPRPDKPGGRKPPWRLIAVVVVLMVLVGGVVWWRIDRQIEQTLQAFRTDVIASHNLVQRAVVENDEEIFRSVLSGRNPAWTAGSIEAFQAGLFVDRSPLGLVPLEGTLPAILQADDGEIAVGEQGSDIEFSADLNEAIITVDQPYRVEGSQGSVILQQTTIYRRGDSRWLLAPPLIEFWGESNTVEGDRLSVIYPARDREIAERLAGDLDAEIGRMCATLPDVNCSADFHMTVRFDSDPATLASLSRPMGALQRSRDRADILELPTPTLVGLPVEDDPLLWEAGYESLSNGYARLVVGAAISNAVGWRCCDNTLLFHILLEYQLGELGLKEWPISEADHQRILESRVRLSDLSGYLRARFPTEIDEDRMWELRAAVDFLANGLPGTSVAGIQRSLDQTRSFDQFLNRVSSQAQIASRSQMPNNLDAAWWLYSLDRDALAPSTPIAPSGSEELFLSCQAVDGNQPTDTSSLLRFSFDDGIWNQVYTMPGFIWMAKLPDPRMMLLQEFSNNDEVWRTNVWRDGGRTTVFAPSDSDYSISFGETDAPGERMVVYSIARETESVSASVVDLRECDENGCRSIHLPGSPIWSPDGESAVYVMDDDFVFGLRFVQSNQTYILVDSSNLSSGILALGPGDAQAGSPELTPLAPGRSPFWIDNRTYGYIRPAEMDGPTATHGAEIIVTGTINDPTPQPVISLADLSQFLPDSIRPNRLSIAYVATHPALSQTLFIVVIDRDEDRAYVLSYDLDTRVPVLRLDLLANPHHSLGFSPDGRYLLMTGHDQNRTRMGDGSAVLLLHDLVENHTVPFVYRLPYFLPSVGYDWTADGRRLVMVMEDNLIAIIDPEQGDVQLLPHSHGSCTSVAWVKP